MKEDKESRIDTSAVAKIFCIAFVAVLVIIVMARYTTEEEFRSDIDTKILKKEISETTLNTIEIDSETNPSVFAYDRYIAVLSKNKLKEYTADGKEIAELDVNISIPLFSTNEKYMALAEHDGQKLYLISGSNILWQNDLEGNISRVNVNKNGYVSVIIKNTIYKSVVIFYDLSGKELFRSYISTDYAVCTSISTNNQYLAIAEINYSGTVINSRIKIISVELAQTDPENSVVYMYESDNGEIVTSINYQSKDTLICMFDTYIQKVTPTSNERMYDVTNNDLFIDINLKSGVAVIDKQSSGLFSYDYELIIKDINTKSENLYILSDLPKTLHVSGELMVLTTGNEIQVVNSKGWLLKKYASDKQINNVVVGDSIVGIVYKNKIAIINL